MLLYVHIYVGLINSFEYIKGLFILSMLLEYINRVLPSFSFRKGTPDRQGKFCAWQDMVKVCGKHEQYVEVMIGIATHMRNMMTESQIRNNVE